MCRVSAKRLSICNFAWGVLKAFKKVYLVPQKWKKIKNSYPGSTQNHKNFPKKKDARTLKKERSQKFVYNHKIIKKIIGTSNQPIKTIIFSKKKLCVVP
jgi:hypothetical protein